MAKRDIPYAIERTVNSLKTAMETGVEEDKLLAIYKSRLFDPELVDKDRRNQVLMAVNKELGIDFKMRNIKNASNEMLDLVLANDPENSPDIVQHANELPPTSPEFIMQNPEEFTDDEVVSATKALHLHKGSVESETTGPVNTTTEPNPISEEVNMTTHASNQYNSTTSSANKKPLTEANFNTARPPMLSGDIYIDFEIDYDNQHVVHSAKTTDDKKALYRCTPDGVLFHRDIVELTDADKAKLTEEPAKEAASDNIAEEGFMDKVNNIRPEYLAAGAAVIGAAGSILTAADGMNVANVSGGVIGVGASYFAAKHFLGERENTLVTKSIAFSGGLVIGAAATRGADMLKTHLWDNRDPAVQQTGETVVTVTPLPAPAPVVTVEQPPMF